MKIKLLFQGDSITAAGTCKPERFGVLGYGYVKYAAAKLQKMYPQIEFEFENRGIGGNQTKDLVERLQEDFVDVQPDIISLMIGINDVWHHAEDRSWIPDEVFEARYRTVLQAIREKTNAKLMMMEPFLVPVEDKLYFREDLYKKIEIVRKLAREFADVYVPLDGLFAAAFVEDDFMSYTADGVHPSDKGYMFIAEHYCQCMKKIIDAMITK